MLEIVIFSIKLCILANLNNMILNKTSYFSRALQEAQDIFGVDFDLDDLEQDYDEYDDDDDAEDVSIFVNCQIQNTLQF